LVLKFVALGSCWPLGHPEYRTGVSEKERLRKEVSGGRKPADSSERVGTAAQPALSSSEGPIFKIRACRAMSVMGMSQQQQRLAQTSFIKSLEMSTEGSSVCTTPGSASSRAETTSIPCCSER